MENKAIRYSINGVAPNLCLFLTMLFCALRACDVATWNWYWVISPILISKIIGIVSMIVSGVFMAVSLIKDR